MKKNVFLALLLCVAVAGFAQTTPNWLDLDMQRSYYPDGQYFKGYAEGTRQSGESLENATKRLKDAARAEAASTVRVHISSTTKNNALSQTLHTMEGTFRQSTREISKSTTTTTDMELPGLQVETYQNPQTGVISAFAYVKKSTLIRQLEKKITVCLAKIESQLEQVEQLVANGQKLEARAQAEKVVPKFLEVEDTQKLLAAVDENADEETLQLQETRTLQARLFNLIAQLKNGLNIYFSCTAGMFTENYYALANTLKGELSKLGCTFVNKPEEADWAIYVHAAARKYNEAKFGDVTTYFTYVDAKVSIDKVTTGQRIYEDQFAEKGGHTLGFTEAARQAYRDITPKLNEAIQEQIKQ